MSLTRAISNANSGLANAGFRADVTASNIANASTPGYVKRSVVSSENIAGGQGNGVSNDGVERAQDTVITRLRREADSASQSSSLIAGAYESLSSEIGEPGSGYGLFQSVENLEGAFISLQATPESSALQSAAVSAASEMAGQFNALSSSALDMRHTADRQIASDVATVNNALHRLDEINGQMNVLTASYADTSAIEDERQTLLDDIANIIPIKDITSTDGGLQVLTESGVYLLSSTVHELSFESTPVFNHQSRYEEGSTLGLSGLYVGEQEITPGSTSQHSISGGSLAGQFAIRDEVATEFTDSLDSLAADLINRFSDVSVDTSLAAGSPGLFTDAGSVIDPSYTIGTASRISVNANVDPFKGGDVSLIRDGMDATTSGNAGSDTIITNLLDALTSAGANPIGVGDSELTSITDATASLTSVIGEQALRYSSISSSVLARQDVLSNAEIAATGVDTDQELQQLLIIEQAYAANARVIQTVGEMIDRLLQL